jgi:hypothetical protein
MVSLVCSNGFSGMQKWFLWYAGMFLWYAGMFLWYAGMFLWYAGMVGLSLQHYVKRSRYTVCRGLWISLL